VWGDSCGGSGEEARSARGRYPRALRRLIGGRGSEPRLVAAAHAVAAAAGPARAALTTRRAARRLRRRVQPHDVLRLRPLGLLDDVELHFLALVEHLEAGALDGAVVHEDVGPVLGGEETVTLFLREPLDATL